jgi:lipopolysaccharide export system permease protein
LAGGHLLLRFWCRSAFRLCHRDLFDFPRDVMRRLHWLMLQKLPGPFFGWLGTLMFLLLMQFLIRWLPEIAGKGIPVLVICELIAYNLAYMVTLAVPMSVLLAVLMGFGALSDAQAYAVMKGSGISFPQLVWPALIAGLAVTGGMMYFNNVVLPEANFRAAALWQDIRSKQPGFELRPGVFYDGVEGYSILVEERPPESDRLRDITIYDHTGGNRESTTIRAQRGRLHSENGGRTIVLTLFDGEIHRSQTAPVQDDRYEHLNFRRHVMRLNISDFMFERSSPREGARSDRTMPTRQMIRVVDSIRAEVASARSNMRRTIASVFPADTASASDSAAGSASGADAASEAAPAASRSAAQPVTYASASGASARDAAAPGQAASASAQEAPDSAQAAPASDSVRDEYLPPDVDSLPEGTPAAVRRAVRARSSRSPSDSASASDRLASPDGATASDSTARPDSAASAVPLPLQGLAPEEQRRVYGGAVSSARSARSKIQREQRTLEWRSRRVRGYQVEIYKKFSMALSCLIFVLIGAPLGLRMRDSGLGRIGAYALAIFLFYWVTLSQGEKLADRGLLPPWFGMWIANVIMSFVGAWLTVHITFDLHATPPLRKRLRDWWRGGG